MTIRKMIPVGIEGYMLRSIAAPKVITSDLGEVTPHLTASLRDIFVCDVDVQVCP
jgi:hypothetical protein